MGSEGSFAVSFIISGGAAVVSKTAAAPVERVKLMLQSQGEMMKQGRISREYRGIVDCFIQVFKHEGVAAFWRGNTANCLRYFPTQVCFLRMSMLQSTSSENPSFSTLI